MHGLVYNATTYVCRDTQNSRQGGGEGKGCSTKGVHCSGNTFELLGLLSEGFQPTESRSTSWTLTYVHMLTLLYAYRRMTKLGVRLLYALQEAAMYNII